MRAAPRQSLPFVRVGSSRVPFLSPPHVCARLNPNLGTVHAVHRRAASHGDTPTHSHSRIPLEDVGSRVGGTLQSCWESCTAVPVKWNEGRPLRSRESHTLTKEPQTYYSEDGCGPECGRHLHRLARSKTLAQHGPATHIPRTPPQAAQERAAVCCKSRPLAPLRDKLSCSTHTALPIAV